MKIRFFKFHGNGNDFILLDNSSNNYKLSASQIQKLCDRRLGIGADGLILLNGSDIVDFEMSYYNSDGEKSSMCGNGGRCISAFAEYKGLINEKTTFNAFDGEHKAVVSVDENSKDTWNVNLQLSSVSKIEKNSEYYFLDTGSPHYVQFVDNIDEINVVREGRKIRYSNKFGPNGTNVNFVSISNNRIYVRTYERGVEDETLSCGTGVTASALASFCESGNKAVNVNTKGGLFKVDFKHKLVDGTDIFNDIWLYGPAVLVYSGNIEL